MSQKPRSSTLPWARGLEPLRPLAELRIVRCHVDPEDARIRAEQRRRLQPSRAAHDDTGHFAIERSFEPLTFDAPTLDLNTSHAGPIDIEAVVTFVRSGAPSS